MCVCVCVFGGLGCSGGRLKGNTNCDLSLTEQRDPEQPAQIVELPTPFVISTKYYFVLMMMFVLFATGMRFFKNVIKL